MAGVTFLRDSNKLIIAKRCKLNKLFNVVNRYHIFSFLYPAYTK
jgi:hypothetical protein